jgi:hypothetical protein
MILPKYASDILATEWYKNMPLETRGLWHTMRLMCWVNKSIPLDSHELALHSGIPEAFIRENLPRVIGHFKEQPSGRLISPELEDYRATKAAEREKKSKAGRSGGRPGGKVQEEKDQ